MDELSRVISKLMAENDSTEQKENPPAENRQEGDKMALLLALKPHVSYERREKIDKLYSLVNTAYMIRSALSMFGGFFDV